MLRESNLNYTILRPHMALQMIQKIQIMSSSPEGVQFNDAQVTREAVVKAIFDILHVDDETPFHRASIGIGEPGTHYDKPSFH